MTPDAGRDRHSIQKTRRFAPWVLWAALVTAAIITGGYFFGSTRQVEARQPEQSIASLQSEIGQLRDKVRQVASDNRQLHRQLVSLALNNSQLRQQVTLLTEKHGVIDQIIAHLRSLKADNDAIVNFLKPPAQEDANVDKAPVAATGPVHEIVTPPDDEDGRQVETTAAPVPSSRPDDKVSTKTHAGGKRPEHG